MPLPRSLSLFSTLLGVIATGALTIGVLRDLGDRRARVVDMLRDGFRRMWNVLRGTARRPRRPRPAGRARAPLRRRALGVRAAAVAERWKGTSDALSRSWELTKGRRWKVLAVTLVAVVLSIGCGVAASLLLEVAAVFE